MADAHGSRAADRPAREAPLRQLLRAGTRAPHEALDARLAGLAAAPTPHLYLRFLAMNHAAHAGMEPILRASALGDLSGTLTPLLAEDLSAMGQGELPVPPFKLGEPDAAEAAGLLYVLEGSRLGARYILLELRRSGAAARWPSLSTSYLEAAAARGPETVAERIERAAQSEPERRRALDAAVLAFAHFSALLDRAETEVRP
ncbi:hypothetical protein ASG48_00160 [Aurantimonas sp. Leaf443]|nr:hypothetical protein ASG48_00160 [Aurantimonas sp. Leaf443]